nr:unnamed protein product [Spirometra erinaceieuropaei]
MGDTNAAALQLGSGEGAIVTTVATPTCPAGERTDGRSNRNGPEEGASVTATHPAAVADENASVENLWCHLRDTVQSTALAVLGRACRQHQYGFDDNYAAISSLLAEKNRLHNVYVKRPTDDNKAAFYRSHRLAKQRLRKMQDAWTDRKSEEIQEYADRNESKNFFSAIKAFYGPTAKGTAPRPSVNGITLPTEKTQILKQWTEHFRGVLNRPSPISDAVIAFVDLTKAFDTADFTGDRPTRRRAAVFEANRIAAAKAKRETRRSQLPLPRNTNTRTALAVVSPSTSPSPSTPSIDIDRPPKPPPPPSSSSSSFSLSPSSSTASTSVAVVSAMPTNTTHDPDTPMNTNTTTVNTSGEDPVYTYPHFDCTFDSHIGLVGHFVCHAMIQQTMALGAWYVLAVP